MTGYNTRSENDFPRVSIIGLSFAGREQRVLVCSKQGVMGLNRNRRVITLANSLQTLRVRFEDARRFPVLHLAYHPNAPFTAVLDSQILMEVEKPTFAWPPSARQDAANKTLLDPDIRRIFHRLRVEFHNSTLSLPPLELFRFDGQGLVRQLPSLLSTHWGRRIAKAQELWERHQDFPIKLIMVQQGDYGHVRNGCRALLGVTTSLIVTTLGIETFQEFEKRAELVMEVLLEFSRQYTQDGFKDGTPPIQVWHVKNWTKRIQCCHRDHLASSRPNHLPRGFVCSYKSKHRDDLENHHIWTHCHLCRMEKREECARLGLPYAKHTWMYNDPETFETWRPPAGTTKPAAPKVDKALISMPLPEDPISRAANWSFKLCERNSHVERHLRSDVLNYAVFLPATVYIQHMMDYCAVIRKIPNILVCTDCQRPTRVFHRDHRHRDTAMRSVRDFRDLVCGLCNVFVRAALDTARKMGGTAVEMLVSRIGKYLSFELRDPWVTTVLEGRGTLQELMDLTMENKLKLRAGTLRNERNLDKRRDALKGVVKDQKWHTEVLGEVRKKADKYLAKRPPTCFLTGYTLHSSSDILDSSHTVLDHCHATGMLRGFIHRAINVRLVQDLADKPLWAESIFKRAHVNMSAPNQPFAQAVDYVMKSHEWFSLLGHKLCVKYGYDPMRIESVDLPDRMTKRKYFPTLQDIPVDVPKLLDIMRPGWRTSADDRALFNNQMKEMAENEAINPRRPLGYKDADMAKAYGAVISAQSSLMPHSVMSISLTADHEDSSEEEEDES